MPNLVDHNHDGYLDLVFHNLEANSLEAFLWDNSTEQFESPITILAFSPSEPILDNDLFLFLDTNGNGITDRIRIDNGRRTSAAIKTLHVFNDNSNGTHNVIDRVDSGLGNVTAIQYKRLNQSGDHYTRLQLGDAVTSERRCWVDEVLQEGELGGLIIEFYECGDFAVVNPDDFYRAMNNPFTLEITPDNAEELNRPVFDVNGPMSVVTRVESSAPTATDPAGVAAVEYQYYEAKMQAGGRGFLGFRMLKTRDVQTGVGTTTDYHQQFPFTGRPWRTVVRTAEGETLTESINFYDQLQSANDDFYHVQLVNSVEASFATATDLSETDKLVVDTSAPLTTVTTDFQYDEYGNASRIEVLTEDNGGEVYTQTTENTYGSASEDQAQGRLIRTTVTHERPNEAAQTRVSEFAYYNRAVELSSTNLPNCSGPAHLDGLLCAEVVEPGTANELSTEHHYDGFANKVQTISFDAVNTRRYSARSEYPDGRYLVSTYQRFADAGGNAVERKIQEVIARNSYGQPTEVHTWVDSGTILVANTYYTDLGIAYFQTDSTGNFSATTSALGSAGGLCPVMSAFHTRQRSATGGEAFECFDKLGRSIRKIASGFDGSWIFSDTEYDILGRVVRQSEPYFQSESVHWSDIEYDILGRAVRTTHPFLEVDSDGNPTSMRATSAVTYDGLRTTATNALEQNRIEVNNALGEVIEVIDHEEGNTTYAYDALGNLETMTNDATNVSSMTYDNLGRKIVMTDPDKGTWQYRYNAFGDLICQQDGKDQITEQSYDFNGRMITRLDRLPGGSCDDTPSGAIQGNTTWTYDTAANGWGKLTQVSDSLSDYSQSYSYDVLGRASEITTQIRGHNDLLGSHYERVTYDQYGRSHQVWDAARSGALWNDNVIQNHYNAYGYLERVTDAVQENGDYREVYYEIQAMDERGNVTQANYGNGVTRVADYNPRSGLLEWLNANDGLRDIQNYQTRWDEVGNLVYREDTGWVKRVDEVDAPRNVRETFEYDSLNRLRFAHRYQDDSLQNTQEVRYNSIGNITYKSDVGDYRYGSTCATGYGPHAVCETTDGKSYAYDPNGNMTEDRDNGVIDRLLTYSVFDKMERITRGDRTTEFFYGPNRGRYKRIDTQGSDSTTTLYLGSVEKRYNADGSREWKRTIAGVALITQRLDGSDSVTDSATRYLLKDHLGSLTHILDANGSIEQSMDFDAWGQRRTPEDWSQALVASYIQTNYHLVDNSLFGGPITTRGYTDHEMVDEMGIIHMNGRIYDARIARFLQADPFIQSPTIGASLNRYSYTWNNPLNATDPSGYFSLSNAIDDAFSEFGVAGLPFAVVGDFATAYTVNAVNRRLAQNDTVAQWAPTIVGVVTSAFCGPCGIGFSALVSADIAYHRTGSIDAAGKAAAISGTYGAVTYGIGQGLINAGYGGGDFAGLTAKGYTLKILSHAMVGGIMAELQGGNFANGFVSAGVSAAGSALVPAANPVTGYSPSEYAAGVVISALVGGTASKLTGGKFANGAQSGAIIFALNGASSLAKGFAQKEPLAKGKWRALTTDEIELAKSVFGDTIDYSDVRIYNKKFFLFQPKNVAMAPNGNIYFHPKGELYLDNFGAADVSLGMKGLFIHEMTHVWQHQQSINVAARAMFNRTYDYTLEAGKAFRSYGVEQQGDIVRDYYFTQQGRNTGYSLDQYQAILPF